MLIRAAFRGLKSDPHMSSKFFDRNNIFVAKSKVLKYVNKKESWRGRHFS